MTETFDLSKIRKGLQIQDEELLNKYLKEIWSDLSKRTKDTTKGITKVTFNKYYDLPGIISERLFSCFDKDKDGILNLTEFTTGMQSLFSQAESFDSLAKFIFNLYDFNSTGIIKKDDVRVVLSYVPLSDSSSNVKENVELVKDKFEDRVESQEQLFHILNIAFKGKEKMNFEEYINVVKNVNSDIFILLLMFLLEKKPFSNYSIQLHSLNSESPSLHLSATPQLIPQQIASPSLHSQFLSPKLRKKKSDKNKNKGLSKATNLLQLYSGVDNSKVKEEKKEKKNEESKDLKEKRPQRRMRINLNNLTDKTPELSKNTFTFGKDKESEGNKEEEDNPLEDIEEEKPKETTENKQTEIQKKEEINITPEEAKEDIKEIKEEPLKIEQKPISEIDPNKGIVITKHIQEEKKETSPNSDPKVIIKGINILSDDKKNEEENTFKKSQSGIIFKKLIKVEDNSPYEMIKLKPRKLKTKLFFGRAKLDIINENVKNENIENDEIKENKEDKKDETKTNIEPEQKQIEKKELIPNNEIIEEINTENQKEDEENKENEKIETKVESGGILQENQEMINKEIKNEENIKTEDNQIKNENNN